MSETQSVMRRMVRPARPGGLKAPDPVLESARLALPRLADDHLGLEVHLDSMTAATVERDDVEIGEGTLVFQMIHDGSASGLVILSPGLLAGLVEVQVTGRISASSVKPRVSTQTDAVVAAPLLDAWIAALQGGEAGHPGMQGFRRGARLGDAKTAKLTLDNVPFRSHDLTLSLGGGVRVAMLTFILPVRESVQERARKRFDPGEIEMAFDVVLARVRRPYGEVKAWRPGQVIALESSTFDAATLEHEGRKLAQVRLGRIGGVRAIRMAEPVVDAGGAGTLREEAAGSPRAVAPEPDGVVAELDGTAGAGRGADGGEADDNGAAGEVLAEETAFELPPIEALPELDELEPLEEIGAVGAA